MSPDEMVVALEGLRRKHFAAAERHRLAEWEIAEYSDPDGDEQEERRWHRDMAEVHEDIAGDLAALTSPSAIAVAELRDRQKLDIARLALSIIGRSSRDPEAQEIADGALAKIGPPSMLADEKAPF